MSSLLFRASVRLPYTTGLPRDVSENVFHLYIPDDTTADEDALVGWSGSIASFYNDAQSTDRSVGSFIGALVDREHCSIKFEMINMGTGKAVQPIIAEERPFTLVAANAADTLPLEVALCASYKSTFAPLETAAGHTVDQPVNGKPVRSTARKRGRVYVGPLTVDACETQGVGVRAYPNPTQLFQDTLGEALYTLARVTRSGPIGNPTDQRIVLYSRANRSVYRITDNWVDNEWDTQRRRGTVATARQVWNDLTP